jgi:hypothetical protein
MSNYLLEFKKETDKYFMEKLEERFSSEIEEEENMVNTEQYMYIEIDDTKIIIAEAGNPDEEQDENYYYCKDYKYILDKIQETKKKHQETFDYINALFIDLEDNSL